METETGRIFKMRPGCWVAVGLVLVLFVATLMRHCKTDCEIMYDAHGLIPKRCEAEMLRKLQENMNRQK